MTAPQIVISFFNQDLYKTLQTYLSLSSTTGLILYAVLTFLFTFFYTDLQVDPDQVADNLSKSGAYIPGIRPGSDTSKYISNSLSKLTLVGALFLVILAGMPILLSKLTSLPSYVTIGGTGILIVVGVAIETYKQLESSLVSRSYSSKRKRLR